MTTMAPTAVPHALPRFDAPDRPRLETTPAGIVVFFMVAALLALWITTLTQLAHERESALENGRGDAAGYVRAVEEHAVRTFEAADQTVMFFRFEVLENGVSLDIPSYLKTGIILADIFNQVTITDAHGRMTASSLTSPPLDLSDREHIRVQLERQVDGLYISKPVVGRLSKKWSLQMTRRIDAQDGSLLGVAVVTMDPFYFTRFYRQIDPGVPTAVELVGLDGVVRARRIGDDEAVGEDVSRGSVFRTAMAGGDAGTIDAVSVLDGRRKLFAYRKLDKYPLIAIVGIDEEQALGEYTQARDNAIGWSIAGSLIVIAFAATMTMMIRRLERSRREALAASRAKSEFLATMSHELRTPLHGILGYAELLADEPRDPAEAKYVDAIGRSGRHLLAIVNDILDLGKIEAGQSEVFDAPIDTRAFFAEVGDAHRSSASLKGLALDIAVDADVPPIVVSDETKLKQVMNNLVHNAVKFTDRGRIDVRVGRDGGPAPRLRIEVADTGCGIPASALSRIFEKFQQVDSSLARSHEGTGLGLALVRQIVELLGGSVRVASTEGEGSRFTLLLPLRVPTA